MDESFLERPETLRLIFVACFELAGAESMLREHLGPILDSFNGYFRRCAEKGLIGCVDPSIATLGLAGTLGAHYALRNIFSEQNRATDETLTMPAYVKFLLNALSNGQPSGD